jgi:hypothetical protein
MRKIATIALMVVLGTVLVACGGDDSTSDAGAGTSSSTAISKAEFVTKANAICAAGTREVAQALADIDPNTADPTEIADVLVSTVLPAIKSQIADLRELGYPEGGKDTLEGIYKDAEKAIDDAVAQAKADPEAFVNSESDPFAPINQRLADYGLTTCAQ